MGLSRLDSNKYTKILTQGRKPHTRPTHPSNIISHDNDSAYAKINEFGEQEASRLKQPHKILTESEISEIIDAYQAGKTVYELADQYGAHRTTISSTLKKHGVKVTKSKAQAKLDADEVIEMYEDYHTTAEIAQLYGVNPNCIIKCLRDHGIKIRGRWDYPKRQLTSHRLTRD